MTCNLCKNSTAYEEIKKDSLLSDVDKFASRLSEMDRRIKELERVGEKPFEQSKEDWEEEFDDLFVAKFGMQEVGAVEELAGDYKPLVGVERRQRNSETIKNFIRQTIQKRDDEIIKWTEDRRGECGIDTKGCEYCEALKQITNFIKGKPNLFI